MTDIKPNWVTIQHWCTGGLVGFACKGLIRVRLNNETMFIGYGTAKEGLGARLKAYSNPKGSGHKHYAGQRIYEHRHEIEMQIAELDLPPSEIKLLAKRLIEKRQPPWNVPPEHQRR